MPWRPRSPFARACAGVCLAAACGGDDTRAAPQDSSSSGVATDAGSSGGASSGEDSGASSQGESTGPMPDAGTPDTPAWDPDPQPGPCAIDRPSAPWAAVITRAALDAHELGFSADDLAQSVQFQAGVLGGDFALSWLAPLRATTARIGCFEGDVAGGFDHAASQAHPVAGAIRHAAALLDRPPDDAAPVVATHFDDEVAALCELLGGCAPARGALPQPLADALAPVIAAAREGVAARLAVDAEAGGDASFWYEHGGNFVHLAAGPLPSASDADVRAYLLGTVARARLYRAAAQLAFAIEDAALSRFVGLAGVDYTLSTPAGTIEIRDAAAHEYPADTAIVLLRLDTGGDDVYRDEVAANRSASNPVSVAIDLGGADDYGYDVVADPYDRPELLPADDAGRAGANAGYGNYSRSKHFRQGAARNGIALLFDLGGDDDRYRSLRGSQGYAHLGVGVLFDDGGDDDYALEATGQGAASFGIGLLIDGAGNDVHRGFTQAQGFGSVAALGALLDHEGDDAYDCDIGDPALGGLPVYLSPQLPDTGNTSMCQGAGYGVRDDSSTLSSLSGGLGLLRDGGGDDAYDASVFAQGTGYWEGTGLLADRDGADRYDARWYVQGGAAHYAIGVLADGGSGDDVFGGSVPQVNVSQGGGHDYSIGVLLSAGGADEYHAPSLALGASNCNGIGVFVDEAGDDSYWLGSDLAAGLGNVSGECIASRPDAVSIGLMLDGGGADAYVPPAGAVPEFIAPSEGGSWGYARAGLASEHGGGIDAEGPTGVGVESD
ncbi:MAG: hypothetical protein K1X88_12875 [Nannocystaceae bacterium]|nr:hypothetical protein [Nannocystaceae bacterium]